MEITGQIMLAAYESRLQSILVEGGTQLLQSFIDAGAWDEARVITNKKLFCKEGVAAPALHQADPVQVQQIESDIICTYRNTSITL